MILIGLSSRLFLSNILTRISGSLLGALMFYLITNFGVWSLGSYGYTLDGFILCYTLAIPFFVNTIIGDLFFTHSLSYSFGKLEERYPVLKLGEIK